MAGVEANTVSTPTPLGGKFVSFDSRTIGDGDIIQATRQNTNPSGLTQFEITLPSGRRIESEWLREDQLKKALLPWIETIKAEMQADADEVRAQARRAAAERAAPKGPVLVSPSGDALTAEPAARSPIMLPSTGAARSDTGTIASQPSLSSASDPYDFAYKGLEAAKQAERYWANEANKAAEKWAQATADLDRWERILAALGGPREQVSNVQDTNSSTGVSVSNSAGRKRGRPAGSKNKPKASASPAEPVTT